MNNYASKLWIIDKLHILYRELDCDFLDNVFVSYFGGIKTRGWKISRFCSVLEILHCVDTRSCITKVVSDKLKPVLFYRKYCKMLDKYNNGVTSVLRVATPLFEAMGIWWSIDIWESECPSSAKFGSCGSLSGGGRSNMAGGVGTADFVIRPLFPKRSIPVALVTPSMDLRVVSAIKFHRLLKPTNTKFVFNWHQFTHFFPITTAITLH